MLKAELFKEAATPLELRDGGTGEPGSQCCERQCRDAVPAQRVALEPAQPPLLLRAVASGWPSRTDAWCYRLKVSPEHAYVEVLTWC